VSTNPLRDIACALRTLDPADPDVSDLEVLRDLVGTARVVSIGESSHGVREFYQLKNRLLRFLVSELGFTAFVMESGFPEGLAVNDWVLGADGELEHIARAGITYRFGECEEMCAQLQWMRDWNTTHDRKVRFYGLDLGGSCANPRSAIAACLSRLERAPGDASLLALADLGDQFQAYARYAAMPAAERERLAAGIAGVVERARAKGNEIAYRCALSAQVLHEFLKGERVGKRNLRDQLMADNVRWILEREARIVIGAHNGHILRAPLHGIPTLGQILTAALGDDMVVVGTTYASGNLLNLRLVDESFTRFTVSLKELRPPPHSIDALMDGVGFPLHLVDLRRVSEQQISAATAMLINHDVADLAPKAAFDALIHVHKVTNVAGLLESTRDHLARANSLA
jgi:erythromycin esterase